MVQIPLVHPLSLIHHGCLVVQRDPVVPVGLQHQFHLEYLVLLVHLWDLEVLMGQVVLVNKHINIVFNIDLGAYIL